MWHGIEKASFTSVNALMAGVSTKERATPAQLSNTGLARSLLYLFCVRAGTSLPSRFTAFRLVPLRDGPPTVAEEAAALTAAAA